MAQILVFGDSISYGAWDKEGGWVSRLKKYLDISQPKEHDVYNLGIPIDESSEEVLKRFIPETKARLGSEKEYIIIFSIGVNDSQFINSKNNFRTKPEKFRENIQKLINLAQRFTSKVIFISLAPVDESKTDPIPWVPDRSYKNSYIKKYNEMIKAICKENKIYFIEFFNKLIRSDYKRTLDDGIHPNAKGHQKIFETIKDFLIKNKII